MTGEDTAQTAAQANSAAGNVERIRDILFGGQMRDYERRFARLEERLAQEASRLREEVETRVRALDASIQRELSNLAEKLAAERRERGEALQGLLRQTGDLEARLGSAIEALDARWAKDLLDLRQMLRSQGDELLAGLHRQREELAALLERETAQMEAVKLSRAELADLFAEIGMRLNRELELPVSD
jgi:hypothetical protein